MARLLTCFGEVNEPSSRAFWDDYDDEEEFPGQSLEWDNPLSPEQIPTSIDLLLLIEGLNVGDFGKETLLANSSELCSIKDKNISLHKVNDKNRIIGLLEENLSNSGQVATLLLPYAEVAKNVITITIQPKVEYKSENMSALKDEITFLRGVNSGVKNVTELEEPNFIAGAAAGICSYREIKSLPVNSYIAYTDKSDLDELSTKPILKLLHEVEIDCPTKYVPKLRDQSYLYM